MSLVSKLLVTVGSFFVLLPTSVFVYQKLNAPDRSGIVNAIPIRDMGSQIAEVLTYADGSQWIVVAGNEKTKRLHATTETLLVIHAGDIPSPSVKEIIDRCNITTFPFLARTVERNDELYIDCVWCCVTGNILN